MNYNLILPITIFFCSCIPTKTNNISTKSEDSIELMLQGHWNILYTEEVDNIPFMKEDKSLLSNILQPPLWGDEAPSTFGEVSVLNFIIESDSIFKIDDPMELIEKCSYHIEGNYLHLNDTSFPFSVHNDTLDIYYYDAFDLYFKNTYVKSKVNDRLLFRLKKYGINYPLLAGKWVLIREYINKQEHDNWGISDEKTIDFSYEVSDTITIKKKEIMSTLTTDRSYLMMTNGTQKKYLLGYKNPYLTLTPGDRYKDTIKNTVLYYKLLPEEPTKLNRRALSKIKRELQGHWNILSLNNVFDIPFIKDERSLTLNRFEVLDDWSDEGSSVISDIPSFDYIIENDSVFEVDFPMELIDKSQYHIEKNHITLNGITFPYSCQNDTLDLYYVVDINNYLKITYLKSDINKEVFSKLKKYNVNYPLLAGKWALGIEFFDDEGPVYHVDFPHEIPDTINITKDEILKTLDTDRSYLMKTNGVEKKYYYEYNLTDRGKSLTLKPDTNWYSGIAPTIPYERIKE